MFNRLTLNSTKLIKSRTISLSTCICQTSNRFISSSSSSSSATSTISTPSVESTSKYTLPKGLLLKGLVISTGKMSNTSTVSVERRVTDHKTLKEFKKNTNYLVHDPNEIGKMGDQVLIRNCLPVSKRKRFELVEVLQAVRTVV